PRRQPVSRRPLLWPCSQSRIVRPNPPTAFPPSGKRRRTGNRKRLKQAQTPRKSLRNGAAGGAAAADEIVRPGPLRTSSKNRSRRQAKLRQPPLTNGRTRLPARPNRLRVSPKAPRKAARAASQNAGAADGAEALDAAQAQVRKHKAERHVRAMALP